VAVRYHVTLEPGSTPIVVDVNDLASGALDVHVEGRRVEVDVVAIGEQLSVRADGQIVDLTTEGFLPNLRVVASGRRATVRVESPRNRAAEAVKEEPGEKSEKTFFAPMPGRVVKIFVKKGDVVKVGQPLLVMEAMKMENEICATRGGTVTEVHAAAGAALEGNARLVTLG
jgi:biotin carboxyl carrier protein